MQRSNLANVTESVTGSQDSNPESTLLPPPCYAPWRYSLTPGGWEGARHGDGREGEWAIPGRRRSKCKCPEVGKNLALSKRRKGAPAADWEETRVQSGGHGTREAGRAISSSFSAYCKSQTELNVLYWPYVISVLHTAVLWYVLFSFPKQGLTEESTFSWDT